MGSAWLHVDGLRWNQSESIWKWLAQPLARPGAEHLILSDSMSVTLALTKGHSSSGPMNRVCMQVAALTLRSGSSGVHLQLR